MEWTLSLEHVAWAGPIVLLKAFGIMAYYVFSGVMNGKAEGKSN